MGKVVKLHRAEFDEAALIKLQSSGLTYEQGAALGMYSVANAATVDDSFRGMPALVMPYYDIDGQPLRSHKALPPFYRARYLGNDDQFSFNAVTNKKPSRYVQPKGSGVCAYFPKILNWKALAQDNSEPILITEGELKAAKACAESFPTIGLGGVWNFRAANEGCFLLPELEEFDWLRRPVSIVFDSDYANNPNICAAINVIAEELGERGAYVELVTLEDVYDDDRKTGLDDFLVERGDEALSAAIRNGEPLGFTRKLWQMNNELVYTRDPGFVIHQRTLFKQEPTKFNSHSDYSTLSVPERKVRADGTISTVKSAAAAVWLKWPLRRAVDKLSYLPGQDKFCEDKGKSVYNMWPGWGCEPKKGDITPWLELVKFIFAGAEKAAVEWFLDWCAYPIQYPGTKLFSAAVIHGRMTGTGKTLLGYTLGRIYGDNFTKIKNEDLSDTWWAENKQFILGDEISGSDKRAEADAMKALITQEEININVKYVPQFQIPDCVNYYLTSNHADALFIEDKDRRYFVHEVVAEKPLAQEFYDEYDRWKAGDGPAFLMHWLLQRDLSKFNPRGPAYKTAARDRMVNNSKSDLAMWCTELSENPSSKLTVGQMRHQRDLFTSKELLDIYEAENPRAVGKVTANGMARALSTAGFRQAFGGQPITNGEGKQGRYFILRNPERWNVARNGKELTKHVSLGLIRG